jgi:hypothetical protein
MSTIPVNDRRVLSSEKAPFNDKTAAELGPDMGFDTKTGWEAASDFNFVNNIYIRREIWLQQYQF